MVQHHFNQIHYKRKKMYLSRFMLVTLFFVLSGAVTDNAKDLQRILNTPSIPHFRYFFNRDNPSVPTRQFTYRIPFGTPVLTVYRYYLVPANDGNQYKVYVETNERGMHWIVEVDPYLLGLWEGETGPRKPGDNSEVEFKTLQSLVG